MVICEHHDLLELVPTYVAPGCVFLACTKCAYWQPMPDDMNQGEVEITLYDADGNITYSSKAETKQ